MIKKCIPVTNEMIKLENELRLLNIQKDSLEAEIAEKRKSLDTLIVEQYVKLDKYVLPVVTEEDIMNEIFSRGYILGVKL